MSGLAALGVVASASQLAAYGIKIATSVSQIYKDIQDAPRQIREQSKQIRELIELTTLIEQHKVFQSPIILPHLEATLLEARALYGILRGVAANYAEKSIWRYWKLLNCNHENQILAGFNKLEREKSALTLCISIIHTDLLCSIQGRVRQLSDNKMTNHSDTGMVLGSEAVSLHPLLFFESLHATLQILQ